MRAGLELVKFYYVGVVSFAVSSTVDGFFDKIMILAKLQRVPFLIRVHRLSPKDSY